MIARKDISRIHLKSKRKSSPLVLSLHSTQSQFHPSLPPLFLHLHTRPCIPAATQPHAPSLNALAALVTLACLLSAIPQSRKVRKTSEKVSVAKFIDVQEMSQKMYEIQVKLDGMQSATALL
jgi:hypothetical protein